MPHIYNQLEVSICKIIKYKLQIDVVGHTTHREREYDNWFSFIYKHV